MRAMVGLVLGLGVSLLVGAGCKEKTATYCCTDPACATVVTCLDTELSLCDNATRTCTHDPTRPDGGGPCEQTSECSDPGTPFCIDQHCVQCQDSSTCNAGAPVCQATHACGDCGAEADCLTYAPGTPHCGASGACVACRTDVAADCDVASAKPVCDGIQAICRGCQADGECSSGVCDEDSGVCIDPSNIVYVDPQAAGGAGCGAIDAPCRKLGEGIAAVAGDIRIWVKVAPGGYQESLSIDTKKKVRIVGPPADGAPADLQPGGLNAACLLVSGEADVSVERLRLHGAGGATPGIADGVRCSLGGGSAPPKLHLAAVTIDTNFGQGVDASSCDVTVLSSTIRNNNGGGISTVDSTLTLSRSRIEGNTAGGVNLSRSDFALVNNFIIKNGGISSTFGGVQVSENPPSGAAGARFEFNTVAGNDAGAGFASGVRCQVTSALAFKNNIVYANEPDSLGSGQVDFANCHWSFSDIGPGPPAVPGASNKDQDPAFLDPNNNEYHLLGSSLLQNAADTATTVLEDFDGNSRPQQGGWDMGADEVAP